MRSDLLLSSMLVLTLYLGGGGKEPHEVEREVHKLLLGVKSVSCVRSGKYLPLSGLPRAEVKKF